MTTADTTTAGRTFIVTADAQRPASMDGRCFYCRSEIGDAHDPTCVLLVRSIRIRMTVEYEIDVPASWDAEMIEFHRNAGTWCANNAIDELRDRFEPDDIESPCMCGAATFAYAGGDGPVRLRER